MTHPQAATSSTPPAWPHPKATSPTNPATTSAVRGAASLGAVADAISAVAAGGSSVVVGSLSRIPIGALTDRLDARRMFPVVALLTVAPVLYLGHLARSMPGYLISGFFLGPASTTFVIRVRRRD